MLRRVIGIVDNAASHGSLTSISSTSGESRDRGIGTTFTLDLLSLLVAPLSLALHDVSSAAETLNDPVLLLDGTLEDLLAEGSEHVLLSEAESLRTIDPATGAGPQRPERRVHGRNDRPEEQRGDRRDSGR